MKHQKEINEDIKNITKSITEILLNSGYDRTIIKAILLKVDSIFEDYEIRNDIIPSVIHDVLSGKGDIIRMLKK